MKQKEQDEKCWEALWRLRRSPRQAIYLREWHLTSQGRWISVKFYVKLFISAKGEKKKTSISMHGLIRKCIVFDMWICHPNTEFICSLLPVTQTMPVESCMRDQMCPGFIYFALYVYSFLYRPMIEWNIKQSSVPLNFKSHFQVRMTEMSSIHPNLSRSLSHFLLSFSHHLFITSCDLLPLFFHSSCWALRCCSLTALKQPFICLFNCLPFRAPVQIGSASSRCPDANFTADTLFYVSWTLSITAPSPTPLYLSFPSRLN